MRREQHEFWLKLDSGWVKLEASGAHLCDVFLRDEDIVEVEFRHGGADDIKDVCADLVIRVSQLVESVIDLFFDNLHKIGNACVFCVCEQAALGQASVP